MMKWLANGKGLLIPQQLTNPGTQLYSLNIHYNPPKFYVLHAEGSKVR